VLCRCVGVWCGREGVCVKCQFPIVSE